MLSWELKECCALLLILLVCEVRVIQGIVIGIDVVVVSRFLLNCSLTFGEFGR